MNGEGASVKRVQPALGHSTPMITLNAYAGEWPDTDDHARAITDSAIGHVPRLPGTTRYSIKTLVRDLEVARFSGS